MTEREPDPAFQVRDRRGRAEDAAPAAKPTEMKAPPAGPATAHGERSLVGLFVMLASVAAAALEGVPGQGSEQPKRDLQQAAELVNVLELLREKTEGRRTSEESKVLDELIYELQLRYVQATRPPG